MAKKRMLAVERRQTILSILHANSTISVAEAAKACGVSQVTARADLDALAEEGLLSRTRGGAVASSGVTPLMPVRMKQNIVVKAQISSQAVEFVNDGDSILVGSGSTTLAFVKALKDKHDLRILTNDQYIIEYAENELRNAVLISTGGILEPYYHHLSGVLAQASVQSVYYDKCFIGADADQPSFGLMTEFETLATLKRAFIEHARERYLLMDATKIKREHVSARFAGLDEFDAIIMDKDPEGIVASELAALGADTRLITAE